MYALVNSDPQLAAKPLEERARLCYLWDRNMVEHAELVIAEASFPSTGLGIEMQIAESEGTPIILCFRDFLGTNKVENVLYENPDHSRHSLQVSGSPGWIREGHECARSLYSSLNTVRSNSWGPSSNQIDRGESSTFLSYDHLNRI
jgi:hypothetical protein